MAVTSWARRLTGLTSYVPSSAGNVRVEGLYFREPTFARESSGKHCCCQRPMQRLQVGFSEEPETQGTGELQLSFPEDTCPYPTSPLMKTGEGSWTQVSSMEGLKEAEHKECGLASLSRA